jgi:voltage-gated potassium channel
MSPHRLADLPRAERRRSVLRTVVIIATTWVVVLGAYLLIPFDRRPDDILLPLICGIVGVIGFTVWEVTRILRADLPNVRAAQAVGVLFPLFLVVFSAVYLVLSLDETVSFTEPLTNVSALYFTITVFATVGFGDITAATPTARLVVSVQMILDILIVATLAKVLFGAARVSLARPASGIATERHEP